MVCEKVGFFALYNDNDRTVMMGDAIDGLHERSKTF